MKVKNFTLFVFTVILVFTTTLQASAACDLSPRFAFQTKGLSVQFNNKTIGDFQSVEWNFGDGQISSENNPKHFYETEGMYAFSITVANKEGCSEIFESKVYVFNTRNVSPDENTSDKTSETAILAEKTPEKNITLSTGINDISISPNPVVTTASIGFDLAKAGFVTVRLYDLTGRLLTIISAQEHHMGTQIICLERNGLPAGTYIVAIENEAEEIGQKVVFQ